MRDGSSFHTVYLVSLFEWVSVVNTEKGEVYVAYTVSFLDLIVRIIKSQMRRE